MPVLMRDTEPRGVRNWPSAVPCRAVHRSLDFLVYAKVFQAIGHQ